MNIRCSMLPGWNDCPRRAAAKQYGRLIGGAGFEIRRTQPSVGAAVGTAVHSAIAAVLRRRQSGAVREWTAADMESALASFREEVKTGCEWDDTTPNALAAELQIKSLATAILNNLGDAEPVLIEHEIKASLSNGWMLTGHIDLLDDAKTLTDWKTGALARPYIAQTGGYVLALEANGQEVSKAGNLFAKRVRANKPQPEPEWREHDLATARKSAWSTIKSIQETMERFAEKRNPYAIPANPMSLMCSPKYCPAFGTEFCKVHEPLVAGNPINPHAEI